MFKTRQGVNVRFSVPVEAVLETQRHISLQIFLQHLFFLPSITFTHPGDSLYGGGHCIPMSHKSSLEGSCSNVQLIRTVHSAMLRHMLLGIFVQPCSHVGSKPRHASVVFLPISFSLPSEFSESCSLSQKDLNLLDNPISATVLSLVPPVYCSPSYELPAIITPTITIVMGRDESGKPMESSSPESQINTRLLRPGYHHVCSKQWQGNMMLLQFRFPEASSSGLTSINTRRTSSLSSTVL